ncbi:hypothetical protein LXL04_005589 [Taraxacum kok-saghyz]
MCLTKRLRGCLSMIKTLQLASGCYCRYKSFRGEDTRKTFVDHLYKALDQQGIYTYKDDITLSRGESINPALMKAIEESQIAVIIFSKNYANSTWCLDELKHIMKCKEQRKQIVMPVFYDVEPWEVRRQKRTYKEAFDKHELENKKKVKSWGQAVVNDPWGWLSAPLEQNRKYREDATTQELENKAKVESWRKALVEASNICGWETKQIANGHEAQGIKQIVDEISQTLKPLTSGENENLVGMRTRMQSLKSKLQIESRGVRMVGIWGVGGGGKTTLASSIYDEISGMYDGCCFVKNIRVESRMNGLEKLQEKILFGILNQKQVQEVGRVEEGRRRLKARLCHKKVLIVLDDVDHLDQLKALAGSHDWFGDGSRILITTRDDHLLESHRVVVTHQIRLFNHDEAVTLFRKHAHHDQTPMEEFEQLSEEVVSYAGGLPLALTVLGSFLCGRNIGQWESALARLKEIPDKDIQRILRISFDGLEQVEKDLFLDIACLFRWKKKDRAMKLFNACGFHPVIGVEVLRQKALIVINGYGEFDMHDLVQEMGHYIVREKHPKNPEKHSRVWKKEDVRTILAMDEATKFDNIEAIDLEDVSYEESQRFLHVSGKMNKLRWIDLGVYRWDNEQRDGSILPLHANFPPSQLCSLLIKDCIQQEQLWTGYKYLPNLKHMELVQLHNLNKIPDFAGLPNLETFILNECPRLEEIHPSIRHLEKLLFLCIICCPRLKMFPSITQIKKLETLELRSCEQLEIILEIQHEPQNNQRSFRFLHTALRKLDLSLCCLGDEEIGSDFWDLPNLEELNLSENPFSRLDFSILRFPRLKWLNVTYCEYLVELSELPSSIAFVLADGCCSLESFGDVSNCKWLWNVSFEGENKLDQHRGDTLIHSMLQGNAREHHFINVALQQKPNGIINRIFRGNTSKLHLPNDWYNDYCGFLICIVTDMSHPYIKIIIKQEDPPFNLSQESDEALEPIYNGNMTFIGYVSFGSLKSTKLFTSSYNVISFSMEDMDWSDDEATYVGMELIPRKSRSDEVQTTDCSQFWDEINQDEDYVNTFTIQQCDSESSLEIVWIPNSSEP